MCRRAQPALRAPVAGICPAFAGPGPRVGELPALAIRYAHKLAHPDTPNSEAVKATLRGYPANLRGRQDSQGPGNRGQGAGNGGASRGWSGGFAGPRLLLLGFAGAFRRSELVALDVADIEENEAGLLVTIRRSKNQPGRRRRRYRHCAGCCRLPRLRLAGMARRGWH
jgi:hypothetical protein